jgi:glycerol-3-phosphate acyltransferase PlsY
VTEWLEASLVLTSAYLIGSIPIGLLVVRISTGKNVLNEHSGRTGGTNVMRTAGAWAGVLTAGGDLLKGAAAVTLAHRLAPFGAWLQAGAGVMAVLGHNYSIFLAERREGRLRLRGGAGGATALGAGIALSPVLAWLVPIALIVLYFLGYASATTLLAGAAMTFVLGAQALSGRVPWAYFAYGLASEVLLLIALRPNLNRLRRGEERLVGWRARVQRPPGEVVRGR